MVNDAASTPDRRSPVERLGIDRRLLWQLAAIAAGAFLIRLVPVLLTGGLRGIIDYDDGVYMGAALAFVDGRIPYRDFALLHPPGIVYLLSPFAALSWFTSDGTAFAAARLGFMALGAANTFLVGMVASRCGRRAALAAALLYAVWIVAVRVERSTWLIAPQSALLLLALLVLTYPRSGTDAASRVTWRKAAAVGVLIGLSCAIQIWGVVVAAVILAWLLVTTARQPGGWFRPTAAYAIAGSLSVLVAFLPFLAAAGTQMLRYVVIDQLGRRSDQGATGDRIRAIAGLPGVLFRPDRSLLLAAIVLFVLAAVLIAAWRRPPMRLWVALAVVQSAFLLIAPSFFGHYAGWVAPALALSVGGAAAVAMGEEGAATRRSLSVAGVYAVGLAGLLLIAVAPKAVGFPSPSTPFAAKAIVSIIGNARCPTADSPSVLILTGRLRRVLDNGCPLQVSPTDLAYDLDHDLRNSRPRSQRPEFQAAMRAYYGGSDAAVFIRPGGQAGLSAETLAAIRAQLPFERHHRRATVLLRAQ